MPKVENFFKPKVQLPDIVESLAIDGVAYRVICRNEFIRNSVSKEGFKLPASERGISDIVQIQAEKKKAELITLLSQKRKEKVKFSLGVDEYTTVRNRRYFSINLHDGAEKVESLDRPLRRES